MTPVEVVEGDGPVVLGFPHAGTWLPPGVAERLNERGRLLTDTDWHVDRLYTGLLPSATAVRANFHRYAIDANRDPQGQSLYPGQNTTGLVPLTDFDGRPIWREDSEPSPKDVAERLRTLHGPYHAALDEQVERAREKWGVAVLYDCHSIRSRAPFLFEGRLPDFNVGDFEGAACSPALTEAVRGVCEAAGGYTSVVNGRFKGGWTTRFYGRPDEGVHAIQMELAQSAYLEQEAPSFDYAPAKAERLRRVLAEVLARVDRLARDGDLG